MTLWKKIACAMAVAGCGMVGAAGAVAQDAPAKEPIKVETTPSVKPVGDKLQNKPLRATELKLKTFAGCQADVKKHCADVDPGDGRVRACLEQQGTKLNQKCTTSLERYTKRQEFVAACGADIKTHCGSAKAGKGGMVTCLRGVEPSLTETCRNKLGSNLPAAEARLMSDIADEVGPEVLMPPEGDAAVEANP